MVNGADSEDGGDSVYGGRATTWVSMNLQVSGWGAGAVRKCLDGTMNGSSNDVEDP